MFLILGHGLAGALLAYFIRRKGGEVTVLDPGGSNASTTGSGIINPVTGKRLTRSWNYDVFLPAALKTYRMLEEDLRVPLLQELSAIWIHSTSEEATLFANRAEEEDTFLEAAINPAAYASFFHLREAPGRVHPLYRLHNRALLQALRERLKIEGSHREETMDWSTLQMHDDGPEYKGIRASYLLCCEGAAAVGNPFFRNLPWAPAAGEALVVRIPALPRDAVYKLGHGLTLSPWGDILRQKEDCWWVGSNYRWDTPEAASTAEFRRTAEGQLKAWLRLPFDVLDHIAGVRSATVDRKPFSGMHPAHPRVGILNGLGAKGVLMAPLLAENLAAHLVEGAALMRDADVARHQRALMRG